MVGIKMIRGVGCVKRSLMEQISTRIFKYQVIVISMGNQRLDYTKNSNQQPYRKGEFLFLIVGLKRKKIGKQF